MLRSFGDVKKKIGLISYLFVLHTMGLSIRSSPLLTRISRGFMLDHAYNPEAATAAITATDPFMENAFLTLIRFLSDNPGAAPKPRRLSTEPGSPDHLEKLAIQFVRARRIRAPSPPETVPDEVVSIILEDYFGEPSTDIQDIKRTHALSMGAENIIGDLLERYLSSILEQHRWVWCSGSVAKSIDFIRPPSDNRTGWVVSQFEKSFFRPSIISNRWII